LKIESLTWSMMTGNPISVPPTTLNPHGIWPSFFFIKILSNFFGAIFSQKARSANLPLWFIQRKEKEMRKLVNRTVKIRSVTYSCASVRTEKKDSEKSGGNSTNSFADRGKNAIWFQIFVFDWSRDVKFVSIFIRPLRCAIFWHP
jgi:hypothetical protein